MCLACEEFLEQEVAKAKEEAYARGYQDGKKSNSPVEVKCYSISHTPPTYDELHTYPYVYMIVK